MRLDVVSTMANTRLSETVGSWIGRAAGLAVAVAGSGVQVVAEAQRAWRSADGHAAGPPRHRP